MCGTICRELSCMLFLCLICAKLSFYELYCQNRNKWIIIAFPGWWIDTTITQQHIHSRSRSSKLVDVVKLKSFEPYAVSKWPKKTLTHECKAHQKTRTLSSTVVDFDLIRMQIGWWLILLLVVSIFEFLFLLLSVRLRIYIYGEEKTLISHAFDNYNAFVLSIFVSHTRTVVFVHWSQSNFSVTAAELDWNKIKINIILFFFSVILAGVLGSNTHNKNFSHWRTPY